MSDSALIAGLSSIAKAISSGASLRSFTVANLPTGSSTTPPVVVTDGDAGLAWGATVVNSGSGATKYICWYNGTDYKVFAK